MFKRIFLALLLTLIAAVSVPTTAGAAELTVGYDGCRQALTGWNADNKDDDISWAAVEIGGYFQQWKTYLDYRVNAATVRVTAQFWDYNYHNNGYGATNDITFTCKRTSWTNIDDWVYSW